MVASMSHSRASRYFVISAIFLSVSRNGGRLTRVKRQSPVRVVKRELLFGLKKTQFVCDARFQSAELQNRRDPSRIAIVHRSTKTAGKWQTSFFDAEGASSDTQRSSCTEALKELSPNQWRLRDVRPKR